MPFIEFSPSAASLLAYDNNKSRFSKLLAMKAKRTSISKQKTRSPRFHPPVALGIFLAYLVLAGLWILFSDRLTLWVATSKIQQSRMQTAKGLVFTTGTAGLIYWLMNNALKKRDQAMSVAHDACERFELVARASNNVMWDWNLATNQIWWSEGFEHVFGYPAAELEPTIESWTSRLHPEDRERVVTGIYRVINGGGSYWSAEYRFKSKSGHYAQVTDRGFVIHDATGKPVRMVGGITDVTARRLAEQQLELSRRQLRALSARVENLREEERTRISREIHDELGQMLTGLKMDLYWIEKKLSDPGISRPELNCVIDKAVEASELADQTIQRVQNIATDLRPSVLDSLGLTSAIKMEAQRFQERMGIHCKTNLPESTLDQRAEVTTAVFRIFQETLTNVVRHARASEVEITLREEERELVLMVRDNGIGISDEALANPKSIGLLGMRERASLIGGSIEFERAATGGTVVILRVEKLADDTKFWQLV
jgi:PAS domain S-box-containing protein